jgi:hypothetical protein
MAAASHALRAAPRFRAVVSRIVIVGAAATVATGLLIRHLHGGLGTATPPFVMVWGPLLDPLVAVSALALAAGAALAPRLPRVMRRPPLFAASVLALALGLGLALNLARSGTAGWYAIFDVGRGGSFEAANEYLPGLPALSLFVCSPLMLLFGVTSFDYLFATCGLASACLLVSERRSARAAGAIALAAASLMSWALLAVGAWAVIVAWRRRGARAAFVLTGSCAATSLVLGGVLAVAYGYDPIGTLRATEAVYRNSVASVRPHAFWVFGSPVAWGVMLGLPIAAAALRSAARGDDAAVALAVVIAIAAIGGFSKAETERIWLFLVPLACVAAAPAIAGRRSNVVVALLLAQALCVEVLFDTIW